MKVFFRKLLNRIQATSRLEPTNAVILEAGDVASKYSTEGFYSDIYPEINRLDINPNEVEAVKRALLRLLARNMGDPNVAQLIWSLGRFRDPNLKSVLLEQLKVFYEKIVADHFCLAQVLSALEDMGQKLTPGETSALAEDVAKDLRDAASQLKANPKLKEGIGTMPKIAERPRRKGRKGGGEKKGGRAQKKSRKGTTGLNS
jgi:hypothetical protein